MRKCMDEWAELQKKKKKNVVGAYLSNYFWRNVLNISNNVIINFITCINHLLIFVMKLMIRLFGMSTENS